jgi:hypothetical protein
MGAPEKKAYHVQIIFSQLLAAKITLNIRIHIISSNKNQKDFKMSLAGSGLRIDF